MNSSKKFYVTTPIYYATAAPHLGTLYSTILADVAARWAILCGKQTFFLTGTDEFGQKIAQAAEKAGKQPKDFVDAFIPAYKDLWHKYNINYSKFIRTTDSYHVAAVTQWIKDLQDKGDIYKGAYQGWYCVPCETYLTEKDFEAGVKNPLCLSCQRATEWVSEDCYFFKLSKYQKQLLEFYKNNPNFITPKERMAEVVAFVESGLQDLSISRTTLSWGVPFPGDTRHVTYVWADALNNYITGIGYGQSALQKEFEFWWPADLQVMGKDIVRFHAVYWPAFLIASGLALPHKLLVHGWIKMGEYKMSKSRGNSVDPVALLEAYGADQVRYYLVKQLAITQDGQFTLADLEQKIVSDLANDVGNLLQRLSVLSHKYNVARLAPVSPEAWSTYEQALQHKLQEAIAAMVEDMDRGYYHMALAHIWKFVNGVNAYFHAQEPWKVASKDAHRFATIMYATTYSLYAIALLASPVMPTKMSELLAALGIQITFDAQSQDMSYIKNHVNYVEQLQENNWNVEFMLQVLQAPLFKKPEQTLNDTEPIADSKKGNMKDISILAQDGATKAQPENNVVQEQSFITIDDLMKVDIRIGTIITCVPVEGSEKLLKLEVDFGSEIGIRQIFSGVRPTLTADMLMGTQATFVVNLKPRKMMGQESQGMMLIAKDPENKIIPVRPIFAVANGAKLH